MRRLHWWNKLSVQLTIPVVVAIFAIVLGLMYFLINAQQKTALSSARLELLSNLTMAQGSFNRMYTADRETSIPELLSEMHVHPRLANAAIVDVSGSIVAGYEPHQVSGQLQHLLGDLDQLTLSQVAYSGKTFIEFHPEHDHFIAIAPIFESIRVSQRTQRNLLVAEYRHSSDWYLLERLPWVPLSLLMLLLLVVGVALWWGLQRLVVRPAEQLAFAVSQFGDGDASTAPLPTRLPNEFGVLAQRFKLAIRERRKRETQLRKLSAAVEQANESIMITDLDGKIEYVNPAFERTTGYSAAEIIGENPRILSSGRTPEEDYQQLWSNLVEGEIWQGELYNRTKQGQEFREWATVSPLRDEHGRITHYLASKTNITERVEAEAKVEYLAYYDALTELPNRTSCIEHLAQQLEELPRGGQGSVVLFDLDGLQRINDVRGFQFGDAILKTTASRIRGLVADEDGAFVANLGGDLFAVLLSAKQASQESVLADTQMLVKLVLAEIGQPILIQSEQVSVTASAGIVIYQECAESADAIIRHAETAVHTAKDAGGNQTAVYDVSYSTELEKRYEIERELRLALNDSGLELYLQPQVRENGELVGAEVLLRWNHPSRGMVSPADFIAVAEQTDLIVDLGKWIVRAALAELKRLPAPLTLAINISPRQFRKYDFVYFIEHELQQSGADPSRLILEVTENLFVEDLGDIISKMEALQQSGVQFSIDDFGTGYSSLSYLQRLPLQELKIDKSFVQAVGNQEQQAIVDSIVAIASNLRLRIVAEGVETQEQVDYLARHDADMVLQGYLFDKPLPIEDFHRNYFTS
ncbi:putative bifunctional diguanylate cyclase/phosphodiesterase [Pseudidiomarina terrestris]|uniref:putative bifunctional diguanylate cyclase/phosphodiesterase n=1 Tax=Pseudidiomarina terrestris TaxID=2820060 RepID=UPI00264DB952|nr:MULTISPECIES: EAL domain-containing protein [unclassified Pseudidiomarina]MDN7134284.1 EAL domain-containing protein [Pseudidiomarina sp. 1ASP75-5]MDN7137028.1 EAL domain-containing protein [Pseudidiomarina sp. 1ASP75-14]